MNVTLLSQALGEISEEYYQQALTYRPARRLAAGAGLASLAACMGLVWALSAGNPATPGPASLSPPPAASASSAVSTAAFNTLDAPPQALGALFALMWEDYVPLSYPDMLDYFGLALPSVLALPDGVPLELVEAGDYGLYRRESGQVYYDGNCVCFSSPDGERQLQVGLGKAWFCSSLSPLPQEKQLEFTQINGRALALFRYLDEQGQACYYTEFMQGEVACCVTGIGLSEQEFLRCLEQLVAAGDSAGSIQVITGDLIAIDPQARHVGVRLPSGEVYGVDLPQEVALEELALYDQVTVRFRGEPVGLRQVCPQQIVEFTLQ